MSLTQKEIDELEQWVGMASVGNIALEPPTAPLVRQLERGEVEGMLGGLNRLSETTRRAYEKKAAKAAAFKESYKNRKWKRGIRHHSSKKATARRAKEKRWKEQPLKSLSYSWGNWRISQEEWDRCVGHLWTVYSPLDLSVKRRWGYGTKEKPYTIYDIDIVHKKHGRVYSGQDQLIYDSSKPNALDIEKAPEGALLFTDLFMSLSKLKKLKTVQKLLSLLSSS